LLDNNKKKIIYLISSIHPSGPTTVLYNLINNLDKNIYDVFLFILSKKVNSTDNMFKEIVNQIYYFPINKLYHLKKRLRTISPDIVHSQSLRADIIHSLVANKAQTSFSTIHSYYPLDYSLNLFGKTIGSLISYIHIKSLRKISNLVGCSHALSIQYNKKYNLNMEYVLNGIKSNHYLMGPQKINRESLLIKYGIPTNVKLWVTNSRPVKGKDVITTINGFLHFNNLDINNKYYLLIVGECSKDAFNLSRNSHEIVLVGNVSNASFINLLNLSELYISSSLTEGCPLAVLEAINMENNILLSNIEAHLEIKRNHSITDTFEVHNSTDLCRKMVEISNKNKLPQFSFPDCYTDLKMAEQYHNLYAQTKNTID
jgi:hypothetical protein